MAGLYIHIPFCVSKCSYCDFVSGVYTQETRQRYVHAVVKEMGYRAEQPEVSSLMFDTMYIGGGTPTVLDSEYLEKILHTAFDVFNWRETPEVTLESNPDSVAFHNLKRLNKAGINRLSIGVQSLSEKGLKILGRCHSVEQALHAVKLARDAGFSAINVDMMYGWEGQEADEWDAALEKLTALKPEHISCYELTIEDGTPLAEKVSRGETRLPPDEEILTLADIAGGHLASNDYLHYEISNYALPGFFCRHNLNYWNNGAYLGIGCSAASFLPPFRIRNVSGVSEYVKLASRGMNAEQAREALDREARFRESVILALRLCKGLDATEFAEKWGYDPVSYYGETLLRLVEEELLAMKDTRIYLTGKGRRVANQVLCRLV